jgi:hypothetical protein
MLPTGTSESRAHNPVRLARLKKDPMVVFSIGNTMPGFGNEEFTLRLRASRSLPPVAIGIFFNQFQGVTNEGFGSLCRCCNGNE